MLTIICQSHLQLSSHHITKTSLPGTMAPALLQISAQLSKQPDSPTTLLYAFNSQILQEGSLPLSRNVYQSAKLYTTCICEFKSPSYSKQKSPRFSFRRMEVHVNTSAHMSNAARTSHFDKLYMTRMRAASGIGELQKLDESATLASWSCGHRSTLLRRYSSTQLNSAIASVFCVRGSKTANASYCPRSMTPRIAQREHNLHCTGIGSCAA
jgi:hypothetical protein